MGESYCDKLCRSAGPLSVCLSRDPGTVVQLEHSICEPNISLLLPAPVNVIY